MLACVTACGGGGGGGGGTSSPAAQNLQSAPGDQAFTKYFTSNYTTVLKATGNSGTVYTMTVNYQYNPGTTTFNNQAVSTGTMTTTLAASGVSDTEIDVGYFTTAPFIQVGNTITNGSYTTSVLNTSSPFPATLSVGTTGLIGTYTNYNGSAVYSTETDTYAVTPLSPTAIQVCVNSTETTSSGASNGSQCYSIDAQGNVALIGATTPSPDGVLVFK